MRVASHKNAIDAAVKAGVRHIYYTSLAFGRESKAAVMRAHLDTEAYLRARGITYTILREGVYMESFPVFLGFFGAGHDEVVVPGDGGGRLGCAGRPRRGDDEDHRRRRIRR
nr:NmrA family NAD(P)-binding protein [Sorangium cellulosum]